MKLYHFISEEYGLQAIQRQRLKVSHLDNLNDPFELYSTKLTDYKLRSEVYSLEKLITKSFGILCCSQQWSSPLLWSHYANRHSGVALVLEVANKRVNKIKYMQKRLELKSPQILEWLTDINKVQKKLLTSKYSQWSYEDEARIFLSKEEIYQEGDLSFFDFNDDIKLVGILSGPLCKLKETEIENKLPIGMSLKFIKARLAFMSYNVVRNRNYKPRIVKNIS